MKQYLYIWASANCQVVTGEEIETSMWVLSSRTTNWFCMAISMELARGVWFFLRISGQFFFKGHQGQSQPTMVGITYQIWKYHTRYRHNIPNTVMTYQIWMWPSMAATWGNHDITTLAQCTFWAAFYLNAVSFLLDGFFLHHKPHTSNYLHLHHFFSCSQHRLSPASVSFGLSIPAAPTWTISPQSGHHTSPLALISRLVCIKYSARYD